MTYEQIKEIRQYLKDTQPKSIEDYSTQEVATLRAHCKRLLKALDEDGKRALRAINGLKSIADHEIERSHTLETENEELKRIILESNDWKNFTEAVIAKNSAIEECARLKAELEAEAAQRDGWMEAIADLQASIGTVIAERDSLKCRCDEWERRKKKMEADDD